VPGSTEKVRSSATLEDARAEVRELESRLAESQELVAALLARNVATILAAIDRDGPVRATVGAVIEQALADRSAVIDQLPCGVVVYDLHREIVFANRAATEFGVSRQDSQGPRAVPRGAPDVEGGAASAPATAWPLSKALAGSAVDSFECVVREAPGLDERTLRVSALPRVDAEGRILGAICTIVDVSEQARLQRELLQSDRMACIGSLAAGMAHEINNPLAYILANVGFVTEELPSLLRSLPGDGVAVMPRVQEMARALGDARDGAERIRRVVSDLKAFARAEDDLRHPIDVRFPLEAACQLADTEIRHRARLVTNLADVPLVFASELRLRQLFLNLLLNAAQAVDGATGGVREIRVSTSVGPAGEVRVSVGDTGPGIDPAMLPRVFDPFFSLRPDAPSGGFGLATCESIVRAHGGTIDVESDLGRGTIFRITLPSGSGEQSGVDDRAPTDVARGRILVIDDELSVVDSIKRVLGRDHDVTATVRAADALESLARGDDYDLILCDVMMPELGGLELYAQFAETRPDVLPRLVFMTGGAFTPRTRAFLESVPNARIAKPFEMSALRAFVAAQISRTRQR